MTVYVRAAVPTQIGAITGRIVLIGIDKIYRTKPTTQVAIVETKMEIRAERSLWEKSSPLTALEDLVDNGFLSSSVLLCFGPLGS